MKSTARASHKPECLFALAEGGAHLLQLLALLVEGAGELCVLC